MQTSMKSWQNTFNYIGDGADKAKKFMIDAVYDWWTNHEIVAGA